MLFRSCTSPKRGHWRAWDFIKMVINFYKAEASADTILAKLADEVRHSNEEGAHKIAELIEHSIPEELDHAKRLEEAMSACGIEF